MKLSEFKVDTEKQEEGVVRNFDTEGKCYVRIAREGNSKYQKKLRKLLEPYKNTRRHKIPEEVMDGATKEAMAECILLEMVGFEDDTGDITGKKGSIIEDTFENRLKVLKHKDYGEFLNMVSTISLDFEQFKVEQVEEDEGKSAGSSSGTGPGVAKKASSESSKS